MTYIYTLSDPRDGKVRYVGRSKDPQARLISHIDSSINDPIAVWIREMVYELGIIPTLNVIESCNGNGSLEETRWIRSFVDSGCSLLNIRSCKQERKLLWDKSVRPANVRQGISSSMSNYLSTLTPEQRKERTAKAVAASVQRWVEIRRQKRGNL